MPVALQVKLLRVLQERKVRPLGSNRDIDIDVRIIRPLTAICRKRWRAASFVKICFIA